MFLKKIFSFLLVLLLLNCNNKNSDNPKSDSLEKTTNSNNFEFKPIPRDLKQFQGNSKKNKSTHNNKQNSNSINEDKNDNIIKTNNKENDNLENIILMGDSVLDDFYWLKNKKLDIRQQLANTLNKNVIKYKILNYAVDETESEDIINGKEPAIEYINERKKQKLYEYPTKDGKVYPLKLLQNIKSKNSNKKPVVILSVGGNDLRVIDLSNEITAIETLNNLKANLLKIIPKIIKENSSNLILCFCYEPYKDFLNYRNINKQQLLKLYNFCFKIFCNIAFEFKLPMIDLSRTFNPYDRSHYGSTSIEPSNKSGQFIVDIIEKIIKDKALNISKIYYGIKNEGGIKTELNNNASEKNRNIKFYLKTKNEIHKIN